MAVAVESGLADEASRRTPHMHLLPIEIRPVGKVKTRYPVFTAFSTTSQVRGRL